MKKEKTKELLEFLSAHAVITTSDQVEMAKGIVDKHFGKDFSNLHPEIVMQCVLASSNNFIGWSNLASQVSLLSELYSGE